MNRPAKIPTDAAMGGGQDAQTFCEGGCACGAVRYRVTSAPMIVHACHCTFCQKQTGSSNAVNALIEADRVVLLSGEIAAMVLDTPSGHGQRVARCASCGIALWSNYLITGLDDNLRFLRVGTLDDPGLMPPDVHIYTSTRLPWYVIDKAARAEEAFYDRNSTFTPESASRFRALRG